MPEEPIWVPAGSSGRGNFYAAIFFAVLALIVAGIWWACVTTWTVPAIWPAGTSLTLAFLATRGLKYRFDTRREHRLQRHTQQHTPVESRPMTAWEALTGDPAEHVGRAERDAVVSALREHYAQERLTDTDHDQRRDAALVAKTRADLARTLRNLPH